MHPTYTRFVSEQSAERIVEILTQQQHLFPHQPLAKAVEAAGIKAGFCPNVAGKAFQTLQIDSAQSIGRLRRSQLIQLARTLHKYWRQTVGDDSRQSQPA